MIQLRCITRRSTQHVLRRLPGQETLPVRICGKELCRIQILGSPEIVASSERLVTKPGIATLKDLEGKRIAVAPPQPWLSRSRP